MYKICLAGVLLISAMSVGSQQLASSFMAPLVKNSLLLDVAYSDDLVIVVGERGHILVKSKDTELAQVASPTTTTLTSVTRIENQLWIVGHDATILHSSDLGQTWQVQLNQPDLDRPFLDVVFFDEMHGIAIGAYGLFYRTLDSGGTWTQEKHPSVLPLADIEYLDSIKDDVEFYNEELGFILPHFNRVNYDGETLWLAGEAGLIAQSADFGRSWQRLEIDYDGSFFDVLSMKNGLVLAVGLRGNLFVKPSSEQIWEKVESCISTSFNSIANTSKGLFVAGNNGVLFKVDPELLLSKDTKAKNSDGCEASVSLTAIETEINDAIVNIGQDGEKIFAVTASGIKQLTVE